MRCNFAAGCAARLKGAHAAARAAAMSSRRRTGPVSAYSIVVHPAPLNRLWSIHYRLNPRDLRVCHRDGLAESPMAARQWLSTSPRHGSEPTATVQGAVGTTATALFPRAARTTGNRRSETDAFADSRRCGR